MDNLQQKNKTVLIISNNSEGLYHFRKELLDELVKEYRVIISVPAGEFFDEFLRVGCEIIPTIIERHGRNIIKEYQLYKKYCSIIKEKKPSIVLTYTIKPNIYGGIACRKYHVPYISNITGLGVAIERGGVFSRVLVRFYLFGVGTAQKVFFQNESNKQYMLSHGKMKSSCEVLPGSGVNLQFHRYEKYTNSNSPVLLIIGRIMKDKGTDEILEAAKVVKAKYPNVIFRFIGAYDGNYSDKINAAVTEGLIEYYPPQKNIHAYISDSQAILHASYHEGLSNVLLEAGACGRPVIATDVPGCREAYIDGKSGISFNPKSVEDLVNAIMKFLSLDATQREHMGIEGRRFVEQKYNRDIIVSKYLSEIRRVCDGE